MDQFVGTVNILNMPYGQTGMEVVLNTAMQMQIVLQNFVSRLRSVKGSKNKIICS